MDNSDPFDWLQSFLPNDQSQGNYGQDNQGRAPHEHDAFADAARTAQAAHAAFLRFQQAHHSGQGQPLGLNPQEVMLQTLFQPQLDYSSPYTQGQQRSQGQQPYRGQQGYQTHQTHQEQQGQQAHQGQQGNQHRDTLNQQYVRLSDINSSPSLYPSNTPRRAYNHTTASNAPSQPPVATQMPVSRPTAAPHRISQSPSQPQSRMSPSKPSQRYENPPQASAQSQVSTISSSMPDGRNSILDLGLYNATSPRKDPYTSASRSTIGPHPPRTSDGIAASPRKDPYTSASRSTFGPHPPRTSDGIAASPSARVTDASTVTRSHPPKPTTSASSAPRSSAPTTPIVGSTKSPSQSSISTTTRPPNASAMTETGIRSAFAPSIPLSNARPSAPSSTAASTHPPAWATTQRQPPSSVAAAASPALTTATPLAFLPHSGLFAPPRSGKPRRPPTSTPSAPSNTLNVSPGLGTSGRPRGNLDTSAAQNTHNRRTQGPPAAPASNTVPSPQPSASHPSNAPPRGSNSPYFSQAPPFSRPAGPPPPPRASMAPSAPFGLAREGVAPPTVPPSFQQRPLGGHFNESQLPPSKMRRLDDGSKHAMTPPTSASQLSQYARQSPSRTHIGLRPDLVQPLRAQDAALKVTYDPTTIARDVLINADKHPTEKVLNHHLNIFRKSFPQVDISSDLDTFRWDLVDPDTGARDLLLHRSLARPKARPPNTPNALGTLPFKSPSYHPQPPNPPTSLPLPSPQPQRHLPLQSLPPPPPPPPPPTTLPPAPSPQVPTSKPTPTPLSIKIYTPVPAASVQPKPPSAATPSKLSHPKSPPSKSSQSKAPSQSSRHKDLPQPQVVIPPSPSSMPPRRKVGRPKKVTKGVEVAIRNEPTVQYQIFACKWSGCQAELHNLHALQSHLLKVHVPRHLTCGWSDCVDQTPRAAADMWVHVRSKHVESLAWTLGDGPTVPATAETDEETDPSGFKLSIRNPRPETIVWPVNKNVIDAFNRVHGVKTPKQKAEALKDGGCHWKDETGPEADWSNHHLGHHTQQPFAYNGEMTFTLGEAST